MRLYLKNLRIKKGLTQKQLADDLKIAQGYYSDIENGEKQTILRSDLVLKLSKIFNITTDELLKMEEQSKVK